MRIESAAALVGLAVAVVSPCFAAGLIEQHGTLAATHTVAVERSDADVAALAAAFVPERVQWIERPRADMPSALAVTAAQRSQRDRPIAEAVVEPNSWLMLLAVFGLIAYVIGRRGTDRV
jgi:hypothetical protein